MGKSVKDQNGNAIKGKVFEQNENCYLRGESRLLVEIGLKNLLLLRQAMEV